MHERKARMAELSDGVIVLPGGFGTLDEAFEILTWNQLGLIAVPVVFLDVVGYFEALFEFIERSVAAGFVSERSRTVGAACRFGGRDDPARHVGAGRVRAEMAGLTGPADQTQGLPGAGTMAPSAVISKSAAGFGQELRLDQRILSRRERPVESEIQLRRVGERPVIEVARCRIRPLECSDGNLDGVADAADPCRRIRHGRRLPPADRHVGCGGVVGRR